MNVAIRSHWLLLVTGVALAVAAYVASSGPTTADAAGIAQPRQEQVMDGPLHLAHGPNGCHWYQYFAGRWWGPTTKPYGASSTATVFISPLGNLYQCA